MGWTFVRGTVEVQSLGKTQAETRYVLETVLNHLPIIPGGERNCQIHIVPSKITTSCRFQDEFGVDLMLNRELDKHELEVTERYILVLEGDLRHTELHETYKRVIKWLCRLAKRVKVWDVLISVADTIRERMEIITDQNEMWGNLYIDGEKNWCTYLLPRG